MKPSPKLLIPVVLITSLGVGGWYVDNQRARTRSTLSGYFESQPSQLSSRLGGRVAQILVREGESVVAGQPLIEFENVANEQDTQARVEQADQAKAALDESLHGPRPEEIRRQRYMVAEAQAVLLKLRSGPLPEEINAARAKLDQALAGLKKAQAGARPQEIAEARAAERNARAHLAQITRGLTPEERAQLRARLDSAISREKLSARDLERLTALQEQGAISKQQLDTARANHEQAVANMQDARQALARAEAGSPAEELEQAKQAYNQAKAALDLVLAGTRKEDVEAINAEVETARQNLRLLTRGTRAEDISAGQARLSEARAVLDELIAGTRSEQIRQAKSSAGAALSTAKSAEINQGESRLYAPSAGRVERVLVAKGDLIGRSVPVIRLADPADIWMRVYVPENRIAGIHVGDYAQLHVDGVQGIFTAKVESIATQGEYTPANLQTPDERGKQVFGVRLRPARFDTHLKAGMYGSVISLAGIKWQ